MKNAILFTVLITATIVMLCSFNNEEEPKDKEALGKLLFFDVILSKDNTISCASCHKPAFAFADTSAVSIGVDKKKGKRNSPSAMNVALQSVFFWDGRAKNLEQQALMPIENKDEMNLPITEALIRLQQNAQYKKYFQKIFNSEPTAKNLALAIAAFERTLETSDSDFDVWKFYDDSTAVDAAVRRGFTVFNTKGKCSHAISVQILQQMNSAILVYLMEKT